MEVNRYIKATIGGILGGALLALPWILVLIFAPIRIPFLAFFIAFGVDRGYRLFKGRVNQKMPKFVIGISIFILVLIYFIVFPLLFGSLKSIFELSYWKLMLRETIISLVFAGFGIYKKATDILYEIGLRY